MVLDNFKRLGSATLWPQLVALYIAACETTLPAPPQRFESVYSESDDPFFGRPWPRDSRVGPDGLLDLRGFPRAESGIVGQYVRAIQGTQVGYSPNGAIYFPLSAVPTDFALPPPQSTVDDNSSVFVVNIDSASPRLGTKHPVEVTLQETRTLFWPGPTLALRPISGGPLDEGTHYAAVLRCGFSPLFDRSEGLSDILLSTGDVDPNGLPLREAANYLATIGVPPDDICGLTTFTTGPVSAGLTRIAQWERTLPPPSPLSIERISATSSRPEYFDGTYGPAPVIQAGVIPYDNGGGLIAWDEDGTPISAGTYNARFTIAFPQTPSPPDGYPLILCAHGTGGDYRTCMRGELTQALLDAGFAVMGIDQVHHGARNPTMAAPDLLFFNIANPDAIRDNTRQAALDVMVQASFAARLSLGTEVSTRDYPLRVDPAQLHFFGHSQGGLNGALFLGVDDRIRSGVLSGTSALLGNTLLEKNEPVSIPDLVRAVLGFGGGSRQDSLEREGFNLAHPVITLLQGWFDVSDAVNYGRLFGEPGADAVRTLVVEGTLDEYAPASAMEALSTSGRCALVGEVFSPISAATILGVTPAASPFLPSDDRPCALVQYPGGHFVAYEEARQTVTDFFITARDGAAVVNR